MRTKIFTTTFIAAATFALGACGSRTPEANVANTDLEANVETTAPGNDQSAVESMTNFAEPVQSNSVEPDVPPPSVNNVEANTVGM